jgi:pimeloyl-ACP methyl ester carboxylesterase
MEASFVEQGSGEPVLLIHGTLCDHRIWEAQRENIATTYRYLALDLRYHGTSPWPDLGQSYSTTDHENQVIEFIRALDAGRVHLVGQSYGAYIAVRVALRAPTILRSLVLQEPSIESLLTGPGADAVLAKRKRDFAPAIAAGKKDQFDLAARLVVEALMNKGPGSWSSIPASLQEMFVDNTRTLPLFFLSGSAAEVTCNDLGAITLPTLIINGAQTLRFFSAVGERVAACIPGSRREVIDHASHAVETEHAKVYGDLLLAFLRQVPLGD